MKNKTKLHAGLERRREARKALSERMQLKQAELEKSGAQANLTTAGSPALEDAAFGAGGPH